MKKISIFYIFIILVSKFIYNYKICEPIIIRPYEYDLSKLQTEAMTLPKIIGNKKIIAFNYYFITKYNDYLISTVKSLLKQAESNEKNKINSDLIISGIRKIIGLFGNNNFNEKKNIYFDSCESEAKKISDESTSMDILQSLSEYNEELINEANNTLKSVVQSAVNGVISAGTTVAMSPILKISLLSPQAIAIVVLSTIGLSLLEKVWNWWWDSENENIGFATTKFLQLFNKINELIYKCKWAGNNVILTAISTENKCYDSVVEFYYSDYITYRDINGREDKYDYYEHMAILTCKYRKNKCNDEDECVDNLLNFAECKGKYRRGEIDKCP